MEENDEEIKEEPAEQVSEEVSSAEQASEDVTDGQTAEDLIRGKEPLVVAKYYIDWKRIDEAQRVLDTVPERSAKKFYLQSRIYKERKSYGEQRKYLKKAVKADPQNEQYKKELAELEKFKKSPDYKSSIEAFKGNRTSGGNQMGEATGSVCAEVCCEGCCYGICTVICEGIGSGC